MGFRGLVLLSALAALLLAGTAGAKPSSHNPVQVADATGDSGLAPDIGTTTVGNTAGRIIRIAVALTNRTAMQPTDVVLVPINADRNAATGNGGFEYALAAAGGQVGLLQWNGTTYAAANSPSLRGSFSAGQVFEINAAELGNTTAFDFWVLSFRQDGPESEDDVAPEGTGVFSYTLSTPHIESVAARFAPAAPRAGKRFRLSSILVGLESDEDVRPNSYRCVATLGGKRLRGTGTGGCSFAIPKNAKGKRLSVVITATVGSETQSFRAYVFRVR
jgi:hypothetical protein